MRRKRVKYYRIVDREDLLKVAEETLSLVSGNDATALQRPQKDLLQTFVSKRNSDNESTIENESNIEEPRQRAPCPRQSPSRC